VSVLGGGGGGSGGGGHVHGHGEERVVGDEVLGGGHVRLAEHVAVGGRVEAVRLAGAQQRVGVVPALVVVRLHLD